jgi:hypothetical protein
MPLSPVERDHIIEVEKLKDEIRRLLQTEPAQSGFSKFFQHPAFLLILGFFLTGIAGAWLTHYWKEGEWTNQQNYLFAQRSLDRKSAVIEATFKEVAATVAAADDLLVTYYGGDWTKKDDEERWENWKKTSLAWRIQSKVLSARLAASFANKDIQSTFQDVMDQRKQLGNIIVNLPRRKPNDPTSEATLQEVKRASGLIKQISELLNTCGSLMAKELPTPPTAP